MSMAMGDQVTWPDICLPLLLPLLLLPFPDEKPKLTRQSHIATLIASTPTYLVCTMYIQTNFY